MPLPCALVTSELGHVPRRGEELQYRGFSFKVLRADRRRVRLLRVIRLPVEDTPDDSASMDAG